MSNASGYHAVYADWKKDPGLFWEKQAEAIDWFKPWNTVFDADSGV